MFGNIFTNNKTPAYSNETIDILRLIRSENVGPKTFFSLIKFFGSASRALENAPDFSLRGGKSKPIKLYSKADALKELEALEKNKSYLITYKDPNYSELLSQTSNFPPVLSYKGNISLLNHDKIIAIVGARNSSINGRSFAAKLAKDLVKAGYVTTSGLARGIDTSVHSNSGSNTIAVVAGGIDHIYPPENKTLYAQIAENGLLLAELSVGSKPLSQHFPQRNRIISGLALATVVVEAGLKSGSLITANFALEQNREVFAVPGFPIDPRCIGSNRLIKNGAYLLESVDDIISNVVSKDKLRESLEEEMSYFNNLGLYMGNNNIQITDKDRKAVIELLSASEVTIDAIARQLQLELPILYTIFLELELAGKIVRSAGNKISLIY
jgi:DNA processing protein